MYFSEINEFKIWRSLISDHSTVHGATVKRFFSFPASVSINVITHLIIITPSLCFIMRRKPSAVRPERNYVMRGERERESTGCNYNLLVAEKSKNTKEESLSDAKD